MKSKYWMKLYHETLNDPKMQRLSDRLFRRTIECFLLAAEHDHDGCLPPIDDIAWTLRCDQEQLETELFNLSQVGILSHVDGIWNVTNFSKRQAAVSSSERTKLQRERDRNTGKVREYWEKSLYADLPETAGVYELLCTATGKRYIGASKNIKARVRDHLRNINIGVDHHPMAEDIIKHGKETVIVSVLEHTNDTSQLPEIESSWLSKYDLSILYNTEHKSGKHRDWDDIGTERPTEKRREEKDIDIDASVEAEADLFKTFSDATKLKPNGSPLMNEKYHKTLSAWVSRGVTSDMITTAVQRAKGGSKTYTISGPWSLDSFINNILMEREQSHASLEGYSAA